VTVRNPRSAWSRRRRRSTTAGHRIATAGFALARGGFGLALIAAPTRVARGWLGDSAGEPPTQVVIRGLGARDVALAAGALAAAARNSDARPWLAGGIACDCADMIATLADREALPPRSPVGTTLLAGASAIAGGALAVWAGNSRR
jgi:hypothetical protein